MHLPDKRRSRRIRIGQPMKVRVLDSKDTFEELNITKNVSREGLFFISALARYHEGMRLYVTVPHHNPHDPHDREYLAQVVRREKLDEGQYGVALQFLSEVKPK
jgi:hypothetical protein